MLDAPRSAAGDWPSHLCFASRQATHAILALFMAATFRLLPSTVPAPRPVDSVAKGWTRVVTSLEEEDWLDLEDADAIGEK